MKRRTFVGGAVGLLCVPFPVLGRKCPYRIETMDRACQCGGHRFFDRDSYRFFDGDEIVGWYNRPVKTFITGIYRFTARKPLLA